MIRHSTRPQRTLKTSAEVSGVGFISGADIRLRFVPAPASHGIIFVRTDLTPPVAIPAHVNHVISTGRRTTLGNEHGDVTLVEHVLAALYALRIDNCRVELDGPEPPGLDGSAKGFVDALRLAGIRRQDAPRSVWHIEEPVIIRDEGKSVTIHPGPADELCLAYFLDYGGHPSLRPHRHSVHLTPDRFINTIAPSRTFILESEINHLRAQGIGARTTEADLLVFGEKGVLGNRTRYADEPARHKVLDLVGDLALIGADLRGYVIGYRSGHPHNVELARKLSRLMGASPRARKRAG